MQSTYHAAPRAEEVLGAASVSKVEVTSSDGRWYLFGNTKVVSIDWNNHEDDLDFNNWDKVAFRGPSTVTMSLEMVPDERGVAYTLQDKRHGVEVLVSKHLPAETKHLPAETI